MYLIGNLNSFVTAKIKLRFCEMGMGLPIDPFY